MATETLTAPTTTPFDLGAALRVQAVKTLGIDLDSYQQAMTDASECHAAVSLLAEQLTGRDRGLAMLLRGISAHLALVADELRVTGKAFGIEAAPA